MRLSGFDRWCSNAWSGEVDLVSAPNDAPWEIHRAERWARVCATHDGAAKRRSIGLVRNVDCTFRADARSRPIGRTRSTGHDAWRRAMSIMSLTVQSERLQLWRSEWTFILHRHAHRSRLPLTTRIERRADRGRSQQQLETLSPHLCRDVGLGVRDSAPPWAWTRSIRQCSSHA